ncbi:hypothetical protein PG993_006874 [Apiospora rasikravindrae]|uniref:DUF1479 domain-containing protein n=1 Tax=Apiospora rasikravindrae TaxID=990691 RepID=A0ABR1SY39_9PEZI
MSTADVVAQRGASNGLLPARATAATMSKSHAALVAAATATVTLPMSTNATTTTATTATTTTTTNPTAAARPTTPIISSVEIPYPSEYSTSFLTPPTTIGTKRVRNGDHKEGRRPKLRQRTFTKTMEPPVLSFYGEQPVPLPSRFGSLKRKLVAGHEAELQTSWSRLLDALRDEIKHIESRGTDLIPEIQFGDIGRSAQVSSFCESVKRYGIGVVRGVVAPADARAWVDETKSYLETKHEFKPPPAQDPTCFDFFWSPCQVRARAHPNVLAAQKFAMSLWDTSQDDNRLATRCPISYADRIRIDTKTTSNLSSEHNGNAPPADVDPLHPVAASTLIAQIDNGSLERWEQDGYGQSGTYDQIWKGQWESYNPWDPTGRVNATTDLYNGAGACSMFRMFQGILALTTVEPGMVRLLPSPKLSTAYFLLRPFFSPKQGPPEGREQSKEEWAAYLDADNWQLDKDQNTIIHGAVPGHAQRVTESWHPHLQLRSSLVAPPTLEPGDYIVWHPDQAYAFEKAPPSTSMLVYTPAAPLTQTNALFLARQRKAFQRGHPGPDFDSTGSGLGSEAPHTGRLEEKDIAEVGGEAGLQAMGLAPWTVSKSTISTPPATTSSNKIDEAAAKLAGSTANNPTKHDPMAVDAVLETASDKSSSTISAAEAEVIRLANIILFPDRYDFWMPSRVPSRAATPLKSEPPHQQPPRVLSGPSSVEPAKEKEKDLVEKDD